MVSGQQVLILTLKDVNYLVMEIYLYMEERDIVAQ